MKKLVDNFFNLTRATRILVQLTTRGTTRITQWNSPCERGPRMKFNGDQSASGSWLCARATSNLRAQVACSQRVETRFSRAKGRDGKTLQAI